MKYIGLILAAATLSLGGCIESRTIYVTDGSGNPIAGAAVRPIALSISGEITYTDQNGRATLQAIGQRTQRIAVSKDGYESADVPVAESGRTHISLKASSVPDN